MNAKQIGLSVLLADHLALTGYAVFHYGIGGFLTVVGSNAVTLSLAVDLMIALGLAIVWMWRDARSRGVSPVPYAIATLALGSAGPLVYLIRRAGTSEPAHAASRLVPRAA